MRILAIAAAVTLIAAIARPIFASDSAESGQVAITGEILDLACYLDHEGKGKGHKDCAETCIKSGLPVGIKDKDDGKTYLIIGAHKPLNEELAKHAAEIVTVSGKLVERDGIRMISNARIVD